MASKTRRRCDRGSISVELAILAPIAFLLLALIVQVGLWANATHTAQAAAAVALAAARAETGSTATGQAAAEDTIAHFDDGPLGGTEVAVSRSAQTVTVTVTGEATSIIPGLTFPVEATATGPVEVFVPDTGAP
jgi:Flp pilus assembly protein TadG